MARNSSTSRRRPDRNRSRPPNNVFPAAGIPVLFPFRRNVKIWMSGMFTGGGIAVIREGRREVKVNLPAVEFAVLAILIMAARRALSRKPFSAAGFISAGHLGRELERWSTKGYGEYVARHVHTLRTLIITAWSHHASSVAAKQFAHQLIETNLGAYRLSTRPKQLHMDIVLERPLDISLTKSPSNLINIEVEPSAGFNTANKTNSDQNKS
jgi:hypothetical protein